MVDRGLVCVVRVKTDLGARPNQLQTALGEPKNSIAARINRNRQGDCVESVSGAVSRFPFPLPPHNFTRRGAHSGWLDGASTIATASGSVAWNGKCVCRSTELRKHRCDGCVCVVAPPPQSAADV